MSIVSGSRCEVCLPPIMVEPNELKNSKMRAQIETKSFTIYKQWRNWTHDMKWLSRGWMLFSHTHQANGNVFIYLFLSMDWVDFGVQLESRNVLIRFRWKSCQFIWFTAIHKFTTTRALLHWPKMKWNWRNYEQKFACWRVLFEYI